MSDGLFREIRKLEVRLEEHIKSAELKSESETEQEKSHLFESYGAIILF